MLFYLYPMSGNWRCDETRTAIATQEESSADSRRQLMMCDGFEELFHLIREI